MFSSSAPLLFWLIWFILCCAAPCSRLRATAHCWSPKHSCASSLLSPLQFAEGESWDFSSRPCLKKQLKKSSMPKKMTWLVLGIPQEQMQQCLEHAVSFLSMIGSAHFSSGQIVANWSQATLTFRTLDDSRASLELKRRGMWSAMHLIYNGL